MAAMSARGSQMGAGSVVGAPYDVGFRATHGRTGSMASAGGMMGGGGGGVGADVGVGGPVMMTNNSAHVGYGSDQPTDEQLTNEIQNVLATADLMSITKKQGKIRKKNGMSVCRGVVLLVVWIHSHYDIFFSSFKIVRERLMAFFGVDLTQRKEFINEVIERVLESSTA